MLYLGTTPLAGNIKQKLFTVSGTFVVPADVQAIWIDGCGSGGGGGGGDSTPGGGGSGGGAAVGIVSALLPVASGETLTIAIGAIANGGAPNTDGDQGNITSLTGSLAAISLNGGNRGYKGTPSAGGAAHPGYSLAAGGSGQTGNNGPFTDNASTARGLTYHITKNGAGGALSASGNFSVSLPTLERTIVTDYARGGAGNASGGGGGAGASCTFGMGGDGGSNGGAGIAPAAGYYGGGGGGGSGNSAGGNGSPGFVRIYYISKYTVA